MKIWKQWKQQFAEWLTAIIKAAMTDRVEKALAEFRETAINDHRLHLNKLSRDTAQQFDVTVAAFKTAMEQQAKRTADQTVKDIKEDLMLTPRVYRG